MPKESEVYFSLAYVKAKAGDHQAAIEGYNEAINLDPTHVRAFNYRGLSKCEVNDYLGSINDFNRAITFEPTNSVLFNNRGVANTHAGYFRQAIIDFTQAIDLNKNYSAAFYNRGVVQQKTHDFKEAMRDYSQAIEIHPHYSNAFFARGTLYEKLTDNTMVEKEKIDYLQKALKDFYFLQMLSHDIPSLFTHIGRIKDKLLQTGDIGVSENLRVKNFIAICEARGLLAEVSECDYQDRCKGPLKIFYGERPTSLAKFLEDLLGLLKKLYSSKPDASFILDVVLMHLLRLKNKSLIIDRKNIARLILAGSLVAVKFYFDKGLNIREYAYYTQLEISDICRLEVQFLKLLEYQLLLTNEEKASLYSMLPRLWPMPECIDSSDSEEAKNRHRFYTPLLLLEGSSNDKMAAENPSNSEGRFSP